MTTTPPSGVLDRALLLLSLFSMERRRLHLKEISELSRLDKATASRLLKVLLNWGYVARHPDNSYSPGPSNLRLASIFRATSNTVVRIEGPIGRISEKVGQTTAFFVRSGEERTCLARDHAYQDFRYFIEVGGSVSLDEGGAAAQVLQAFDGAPGEIHDATRARGYYISRGERNRHFASIAVALMESDGQFLGALTITGMGADLSNEHLLTFLPIVADEVATEGLLTRL